MPVKLKINSNGKAPSKSVKKRKSSHLPTQKDIAEMYKDEVITPEEQELIDVSMRAVEALKNEQERAKRLEKRQNSLRGKPRLLMQKDFDLPENLSPQEEKLIEVSLRAMKAMDKLEEEGFVW